ncbi:Ribosomal protein S12 methylthiotransferase RimO [Syntrophomonas zehnderi OL-4]|uniref:Ribosomal protein uS12 methylthiotransferase RimO n=1 Tax=Syntrophomonas zehnderi OL-4 TaxID=690567 RepID=A0A0E4C902_9FIRM|nr:30S ribosomal protein S12 methylthiotransferase RimO [Syntrophomonas zehnderi]CFX75992.1 Ribosomal protein S12 methylthiotransferase RimO [Syntrophomonas zehnderi OL-4]
MTITENSRWQIGFISLGCAKNQVDTEIMIGKLKQAGYKITSHIESANIIIINTCGFIEDAREEAINTIIQTGERKETGQLKYLIAAGCLAQRYGRELLDEMPELDGVVGISSFILIDRIISSVVQGERICQVEKPPQIFIEKGPRVLTTPPGSAYLKITEGCNNRCAYCAIPQIRGQLRSRPQEELLKEAEELVKKGTKELVLIGQDTALYAKDLAKGDNLSSLIEKLSTIDGLKWIRLMYLHPAHIDRQLIEAIVQAPKVLPYLDIPVQHAADPVLKAMNRQHVSSDLTRLVNRLKEAIPDLVLRTTVMLGFPGETEEDFAELFGFVAETEFDWLGAFAFTPEEGTLAYDLPNQIPDEVKQERLDAIMKLQKSITRQKNKQRLQQNYDVLISSRLSPNLYMGRAYFQAPQVDGVTIVRSEHRLHKGEFVKVNLKAIRDYDVIGESIE